MPIQFNWSPSKWHIATQRVNVHTTVCSGGTLTPRYDSLTLYFSAPRIRLVDIFEGALPNIENAMFDEEVVLVLVPAVELLVAHVALKVIVSLAQLAVTQ